MNGVGVFSVRLRYQVLDESTLPKKPAELTITIADASGARIHTWNLGYLQRKTNENKGKIGSKLSKHQKEII